MKGFATVSSNTTNTNSGAESGYPSRAHEFNPGFVCVSTVLLVIICVFVFSSKNCENRNDPDLVQTFLKKWWVESDFKHQTSPFQYGSKFPAVTIIVFITILEQNR
jgi:hypothetical protein